MDKQDKNSPVARRASAVMNKKILSNVQRKDDIRRRSEKLTSEELDAMYAQVSSKLKAESTQKKAELDAMDNKSAQNNRRLSLLRETNKEEMKKTEVVRD